MVILLRYALLLGLGLASLFAFISAGSVTGQMVLASGEQAQIHPQDMSVWVLGAIATLGIFSVIRFLFARVPFLLRDWFRDHKEKLATAALACGLCVFFVVL